MRSRHYSQCLMRALDGEDAPLDRELTELARLGERVSRAVPAAPRLDKAARARIWEKAFSAAGAPAPRERGVMVLPRVAWAAAAACLVTLAVAFTVLLLRGGEPPLRERVEVAVLRVDAGEFVVRDGEGAEGPAEDGQALAEGEVLVAAEGSRGWVEFEGGSILRLHGRSHIALVEGEGGVEVEVLEGRTYHRVASGARYTARSGGVAVTAMGTAFVLDVEDARRKVVSIQSSVRVEAGEEGAWSALLEEGDALILGAGGERSTYDVTRGELDDEWLRWNKALDEMLGLPTGILRLLEEETKEEGAGETPDREPADPQQEPSERRPAPEPAPQPAPQPPVQKGVTLSASAREGAVDFTWTLSGYSGFQGFKLCRSETNAIPSYPGDWWKYVDGAATRSATDTSVKAGHTYHYRLAVYSQGEVLGYSNAVQVKVPGSAQDLCVSLSAAVEGGKVKLTWSVGGTGSYDGFKICRSETNSTPSYPGDSCAFADAGARAYADTSVSSGHTYYYRVGIYKGGSILVYSDAVKAVVP